MDDKELAKLSKDDNVIIVFAFGKKLAFKMAFESEKYLETTISRIGKKLRLDYKTKDQHTITQQNFRLNVKAFAETPCPEPTCVHTFHSDLVLTDHVQANHPYLYTQLVAKNLLVQPKQETKSVTYL